MVWGRTCRFHPNHEGFGQQHIHHLSIRLLIVFSISATSLLFIMSFERIPHISSTLPYLGVHTSTGYLPSLLHPYSLLCLQSCFSLSWSICQLAGWLLHERMDETDGWTNDVYWLMPRKPVLKSEVAVSIIYFMVFFAV